MGPTFLAACSEGCGRDHDDDRAEVCDNALDDDGDAFVDDNDTDDDDNGRLDSDDTFCLIDSASPIGGGESQCRIASTTT